MEGSQPLRPLWRTLPVEFHPHAPHQPRCLRPALTCTLTYTHAQQVRGRRALAVHEPKVKVDMTKYVEEHEFIFDEVLSAAAGNAEVYARTAAPLIAHVFRGANATCFAYGQTGSGKTFTMLGNGDGIYILAARDIFKTLAARENAHLTVYVSFFEIYGGTLYDLLNDRAKLHAREDAKKVVRIQGLEERLVVSADEFVDVIEYGHTIRSTAATGVNADSSRSHAILQVTLRDESGGGQRKRSKGGGGGNGGRVHGKFSFIDLAGSERARDTTDNDRQRRIEGAEINKSLLALKVRPVGWYWQRSAECVWGGMSWCGFCL